MKKLLLAFSLLNSGVVVSQLITEVIYPQYIQGAGTDSFAVAIRCKGTTIYRTYYCYDFSARINSVHK